MSIKGREIKKVGIATIVTFTCLSTLSSMNLTSVQAAEQAGQSQAAPATNSQASQTTGMSGERTNTSSSDTQNSGESYLEQRVAEIERRHQEARKAIEEESNSAIYDDNNKLSDGKTVGEKVRELNDNNALGVASEFHIFSKDKATLNAHTEGNVATNTLVDNTDFGTRDKGNKNNTKEDIDYVRHVDGQLNSASFNNENGASHVVFQGGFEVVETNGNQVPIKENGVMICNGHDRMKQNVVTVLNDDSEPYIDLDQEFLHLGTKSNAWSKKATSENVKITENNDPVNKHPEVDVSDAVPDKNNFIYVNLNADKLHNPQTIDTLKIKGLGKNKDKNGDLPTIIINVNLKDKKSFNVTSELKLEYLADDGTTKEFGGGSEQHNFHNQIIWNFGTHLQNLNLDNAFLGSVLAPDASIVAGQSSHVDGNIIGREVTIESESHRWDLVSHTHRPPHKPFIPDWGFIVNPHPVEPKPGNETKPKEPKPGNETKPKEPKPGNETKPKEPKPGNETKPKEPKPGNETKPTPSHEEEVPPTPETPNQPSNPNTPPNVPDDFVPEKEATFTYSFAHSHGQDFKDGQKSENKKESYTRTVRDKADTVRTVTTVGAKTVDFPKDNVVVSGQTKTNNNNVVNTATKVVSTNSNSELPKTGANAGWMASLIGFATFALGAIGLKLNKKNR